MTTFTERITDALGHLDAAMSTFDAHELRTLAEHSEALLTQFTPIKVGERAVIVAQPKCDNDWWNTSKTLEVGRTGRVTNVEYYGGRFVFTWVPDQEWLRGIDGEWVERQSRHTYCLTDKFLELVTEGV